MCTWPCYLLSFQLQGTAPGAGHNVKADTGEDLPEDLQIGFSGKGSGIYGSFATGKPSRPPGQVSLQSLLD